SATIMASAYDWLGWTGIALLVVLALSLTFLIIAQRLQRWASPVELAVALTAVALVLHPFSVARPMVLLWPMLALWTEGLLRAREQGRAPSWWLVPLMTLWINLHASFAVGLGIAALFGLEALIESKDRLKVVISWGAFGLACGVAALINPHGLAGVLMPLGAFTSSTITLINEFRPTDFTKMPTFEVALLLLIGVGFSRGARLAPVRLFLLLAMLHLALAHMRHQALFIIIAALIAAPAMTAAWIVGSPPAPGLVDRIAGDRSRRPMVLASIIGALALLAVVRAAWSVVPPESDVNPVQAFERITPEMRKQPVLNEYSMGGPLILRGMRVFMDGRTDVYGDDHFRAYRRIISGEPVALADAQQRWHFCWSIFPPENREMIAVLDRSAGWKRIYTDKFAIIHVRAGCRASVANVA
ncbi:MAG: hypothetical protein ACJ8EY_09645, partial [Sphingomicrobium sp.]